MDLTIIIVNWNTKDLLENCLRSIEDCGGRLAVQTIVVDNNSADGSREMVRDRFPNFTLINSGANLGFARGNNLGLKQAKAPLVLFLNPDTEIRGNALEKMVEFMGANPNVGGMGCKIRDVSGSVQQLGLQWHPSPATELLKFLAVSSKTYERLPRFFPYHDPEVSGYVTKLFGACLLVRKTVLDSVGSFDERFFMYCEDVDLCYRIAQAGWKLFYLSDAEILHLGASASAKAPSSFAVLMTCDSFSKFMLKHHGRMGSAGYRAAAFLGSVARLSMLAALSFRRMFTAGGNGSGTRNLRGSKEKYLSITRWALGLQKPVVRN